MPHTDRFWSKVNKITESGCWEWTAGLRNAAGYGGFCINRSMFLAHRISWEIENGKIPNNSCVLHKCDNPLCVKPSHLFLGSRTDNNVDRMNKGRSRPRIGSLNGRSKLTENEVRVIRIYHPTLALPDLAKSFNVSKQVIWSIIHRKTWVHA